MEFMTVTELNAKLILLVKNERKLTEEILNHINLFEKCGGYLRLGYGSMFQYLTRALGYSEDQAYRRLKAARLLNFVPEVGEKLKSGALNLSQAAEAQRAFEKSQSETGVAVDGEVKKQIINAIENSNGLVTREILAKELNLTAEQGERLKPQGDQTYRLELTLTKAQFEKLNQIKTLLSHQVPDLKTPDILEKVFDLFLEKHTLTKSSKKGETEKIVKSSFMETRGKRVNVSKDLTKEAKPSRYIPVEIKRALYQRAKGCCEHIEKNGVRCKSRYQLEIEHTKPFSQGGLNTLDNLMLACKVHNSYLATKLGIGFETTIEFNSRLY